MAKILIAGCGKIGSALGLELIKAGHTVYGLRRQVSNLPELIHPIEADLTNPLPTLPDDIDYVYYIVAAAAHNDRAYYQAYVSGVTHLIEALKRQASPIKRLYFVSSTSVFGQTDASIITEDSPVTDHNFGTKRLLEGEQRIQESGFPNTIIRFGGIYGPGRTHLIEQIIAGKARCVKGVYSNRIHSTDCVRLLQHLLTLAQPAPLYIGVDDAPTYTCEVYEWLADQLSIAEIEYLEAHENSRSAKTNKQLSNARIKATGFNLAYPSYKEGYIELLDNL